MQPRTELILIRHGETEWNAQGRIQGYIDVPLNARGVAQAAALGDRFRQEAFDVIYSSDLQRADQTALRLVEEDAQPIRRDPRLRERQLGVLEGLTHAEAAERHPDAWIAFKARQPETPVQGGEMLGAFFRRAMSVLVELSERHRGERIVVVTHGGVLDVAYRHCKNLPLDAPRDFPILNASVNLVRIQDGHWSVENWGDVSHLSEIHIFDAKPPLPFTL